METSCVEDSSVENFCFGAQEKQNKKKQQQQGLQQLEIE